MKLYEIILNEDQLELMKDILKDSIEITMDNYKHADADTYKEGLMFCDDMQTLLDHLENGTTELYYGTYKELIDSYNEYKNLYLYNGLLAMNVSSYPNSYSGIHVSSDWFFKNFSEYEYESRDSEEYPHLYFVKINDVKIYCITEENYEK